ncbi:hypothetical protein JW851_01635 [Candidatus Woesearchaeota archaeon]|nr:hypothetical protein [Candidatus Woesearchaeota archaeon]
MNNKQYLVALFLIAFFILVLPYFFRLSNGNNIFIGPEAHYHARLASEIAKNGFIEQDPLSNEKYHLNVYHLFLAALSFVFPLELVSIVFPVLLGLLSLIFLHLSFSDIKFKYLRSLFILFVFVLSPIFISTFALSGPRALALFLFALSFFLFQKEKKIFFVLSLPVLALLSFLGISHSVFILIILLAYCLYKKKIGCRFYIILALILFIIVAFHLPYYLAHDFSNQSSDGFISDLGSIYGFSIVSLLLSVTGLFFIWRYKKKLYKIYLLMLVLLLFSFANKSLFIYSNIIVSILAGSAYYVLYVKKWSLKKLRNFVLLILFCCFLFSALSHAIVLSELPPNNDLVECLEWSRENTPKSSRFFAHKGDGFFIEFWAERSVLLNDFFETDKNRHEYNILWNSFDLRETQLLLEKNRIDYILIHGDLFQGQIWNKKYQGLHFLLNNAETFKRRYHNNYCEIWEYTDSGNLNG